MRMAFFTHFSSSASESSVLLRKNRCAPGGGFAKASRWPRQSKSTSSRDHSPIQPAGLLGVRYQRLGCQIQKLELIHTGPSIDADTLAAD